MFNTSRPVSLSKGEAYDLTKHGAPLKHVTVGLGWSARQTSGYEFDLDASLFALGADGRLYDDGWFIFFNNLKSPDGSIQHMGDDLTGGDGNADDEQIKVSLAGVPQGVARLVVAVTIYEADIRGQNFGQVNRAYIRVVNDDDNDKELARYDLAEDASTDAAMIFAEFSRKPDGSWEFRADSRGHNQGLAGICHDFGVQTR